MATIYQSETIGQFCAAMSGVIVLALVFDHCRLRRLSLQLITAIVLLVEHPVRWISVTRGDCGYALREMSYYWLALHFLLLLYQVYATRPAPKLRVP
jgi:hypothetical protein